MHSKSGTCHSIEQHPPTLQIWHPYIFNSLPPSQAGRCWHTLQRLPDISPNHIEASTAPKAPASAQVSHTLEISLGVFWPRCREPQRPGGFYQRPGVNRGGPAGCLLLNWGARASDWGRALARCTQYTSGPSRYSSVYLVSRLSKTTWMMITYESPSSHFRLSYFKK